MVERMGPNGQGQQAVGNANAEVMGLLFGKVLPAIFVIFSNCFFVHQRRLYAQRKALFLVYIFM